MITIILIIFIIIPIIIIIIIISITISMITRGAAWQGTADALTDYVQLLHNQSHYVYTYIYIYICIYIVNNLYVYVII